MTGVLDRLERGGFVRRERDAADRRKVLVTPVPEGVARLAAHYAEHGAHTDALLARRDAAELQVIADFLARPERLAGRDGQRRADADGQPSTGRALAPGSRPAGAAGSGELALGRAIGAAPVRAHPAQGPPVATHERHAPMKARGTDSRAASLHAWSAPAPSCCSASRWRSRASTGCSS